MHGSAQVRVWLAGATGLIGGEVLGLLRAEPRVAVVHALARRSGAGDDGVVWHVWDWLEQLDSACDVAICGLLRAPARRRAR